MIDFDEILNKQLEFQKMLYGTRWPLSPDELDGAIQFAVQCITDEAHEVLHNFDWKPWRKQETNLPEARKEIIDVFAFVLGVFNYLGMSAEDVNHMYREKLKINYKRQGHLKGYDTE